MIYIHRSHFKCYSFKKCLRCRAIKKIKFKIDDKAILAKLESEDFVTVEITCLCEPKLNLTLIDKWIDNAENKEIDEYFRRRELHMNDGNYVIFETHEGYD